MDAAPAPSPIEQAPLPFAPQPAPVTPIAATPVQPPPLPDLPPITRTPPAGSGLELVETRHAPAPAIEDAQPARPKRVRPARPQVAEEPLQIVETRKEQTPPAP